MGAIATGGVRILSEEVIATLGVSEREIAAVAAVEEGELARRERAYRGRRGPPAVEGRTVILVDDGLATGATMRAAAIVLRKLGPRRLIVAVPVAPAETCRTLRALVDEVVCLFTPEPFRSVGEWYDDFSQTSDEDVRRLLGTAGEEPA